MQRGFSWLIAATFVTGWFHGSAISAVAEEVYTATVIVPDAMAPDRDRKAELTLTIKTFTTEDEAAELQKILEEEGSDALFAKLKTWDKGLAEIEGSDSQKILHVRLHPGGPGGSRVILVTEGQLYMPDRSQDPALHDTLGFIQLDVSTRGKGSGMAAAVEGVRITKDGVLQMVTQRTERIRLENVARKE